MKKNFFLIILLLTFFVACTPTPTGTSNSQEANPGTNADLSATRGWWYEEGSGWCIMEDGNQAQCLPLDGAWAEDCDAPFFDQMWICAEAAYLAGGDESALVIDLADQNSNNIQNNANPTPVSTPVAEPTEHTQQFNLNIDTTGMTSGTQVINFPFYGVSVQLPVCGTPEYERLAQEYWSFFVSTVEDLNQFFIAETNRLKWDYQVPVNVDGNPYLGQCVYQTVSEPNHYQPQYSSSANEVILPHINFMLPLYTYYGKAATAFIMAHEWGHGVTYTSGNFSGHIGTNEALVDCYAGAYIRSAILRDLVPEAEISNMNDFIWTIGEDDYFMGEYNEIEITNWMNDNPNWHGSPLDRQLAVKIGLESSGIDGCQFGQGQVQFQNFRMEILGTTVPILSFGFYADIYNLANETITYNIFIMRADGQNALTALPQYDNGRGYIYVSNTSTMSSAYHSSNTVNPADEYFTIISPAFAETGEFYAIIQAVVDGRLVGMSRSAPWTIE